MYTENQNKGLERFCANRYWRQIFENAPSDAAKEYYAETFAYGIDLSVGEEHHDLMVPILRKLSAADWDYIIANCHSNMGRWALGKCREKHETRPSGGGPATAG